MRPKSLLMSELHSSLADRAVLSLDGPDTLTLLERLVTCNTHDWAVGSGRYGALLTPQGKVIADFITLRTETGVMLDVAAIAREELARRLKLFRLRAAVEITGRDDLQVALAMPDTPDAFADPRHEGMPWRCFAPGGPGPASDAYEAQRIACGVPEQGKDFVGSDVFPADINLDRHGGVDLKKGCFVGQEVVSRMHRRGKIRKRAVVLRVSARDTARMPALSPPDTLPVLCGSRPVGEATSAAGAVVLARLRTDRLATGLADGDTLSLGDIPVTLEKTVWLQDEMAASLNHD